jgi:cellulose synthase/poly-beta-1,6-N-acetylglucosamine synthase-like glycosyltransferase
MSELRAVLDVGLVLLAVTLLVPTLVLFIECAAALLPERTQPDAGSDGPTTVVLVPAHDESAGIQATLESLKAGLGTKQRILVVADNCSDDTAERARAGGVAVVERHDLSRIGKGYAIAHGLAALESSPPDVVIVVDADCRTQRHTLPVLARRAHQSQRPVQGDYLLQPPPGATPMTRVSGFALLVRQKVRPAGLRKLGLPCQLTGSGMAFPWQVIREAPPAGSHLVEDLLIGVELAHRGRAPLSCADAEITSLLPTRDEAAQRQRRRWEHGQLAVMLRHGPRLVATGLVGLDVERIALGLDLLVPPLALLILVLTAAWASSLIAAGLGASWLPASITTASLLLVGASVVVAWLGFGRRMLPLRLLLVAPAYVLWKLPLYGAWLARRRQSTWERTERG